MGTFNLTDTVAKILKTRPETARVFEKVGMDYCCGGGATLEAASQERGLDPAAVLAELEACGAGNNGVETNLTAMSLMQLADHIEHTHHSFLRTELPRLDAMTVRVANVHGDRDSRLYRLREACHALISELSLHMEQTERNLFPMIRKLGQSGILAGEHTEALGNSADQLVQEHKGTEEMLREIRELTDSYTPPKWACGTYRAMLTALAELEADTLLHIRNEHSLLFPHAIVTEEQAAHSTAPAPIR